MREDLDAYAVPAALLHDSVEQGSITWADLRAAGPTDRLIELIDALTERIDEQEADYFARCAADPLALRISAPTSATSSTRSTRPVFLTIVEISCGARAARRLSMLESLVTQLSHISD